MSTIKAKKSARSSLALAKSLKRFARGAGLDSIQVHHLRHTIAKMDGYTVTHQLVRRYSDTRTLNRLAYTCVRGPRKRTHTVRPFAPDLT